MARLVPIVAGSFLIVISNAYAGDRPIIEAIEGDKVVVVKTPDGNRIGGVGTEVNFGDTIKTGPHASAKILYPDGSKLLVGKATEMEVQQYDQGTQFNELRRGEIRGIIKKLKKGDAAKPRFVVRSRAAVMGVRGTDFVYNTTSELKAEVRTLDGVVDVAKDEETLMSGKGVSVRKDQFVEADATKNTIAEPQKFDRKQYLSSMQSEQPAFVTLIKDDRDAISREDNSWENIERRGALQLLSFQIGALRLKQNTGGELVTSKLSWNPELRLWGPFTIRGHAAIFPLKGNVKNDTFYGLQLGGMLSFTLLNPIILELGVIHEGWWPSRSYPNTGPIANVAWKLGEDRFFERIFVGVSHYNYSPVYKPFYGCSYGCGPGPGPGPMPMPEQGPYYNGVDEVNAGIGFQF